MKKKSSIGSVIDEMEKLCNENAEVKKSLEDYLKNLSHDKEWKKAMRLLRQVRRPKSKKSKVEEE